MNVNKLQKIKSAMRSMRLYRFAGRYWTKKQIDRAQKAGDEYSRFFNINPPLEPRK